MFPMRGILGQAPGYGGGVRLPQQQHGGGGYLPDSGNNYGSGQMTGAGGYGNNQMSDDYGANQMGGNYGGNQMSGNYGNGHMSGNYGGNDVSGGYGGNDMSGGYGGNDMSGGYGGNDMSGGYGDNQMSDNYGSNQMSGNYESDQMSSGYGGNNQMSGNYGANQTSNSYETNNVRPGNYGNNQVRSGNFGANQRSSNFGSNQASGNFGGNQKSGNFGGNQSAGNFGGNQSSGNFGGNQRPNNFGSNQGSGNFGGNQTSGNFGGNQKPGNFGGNQMKSGNFGGNQKSGNFGGSQKSGNFGGNQKSGSYGGNQMSGNYGSNQMSGNFGGNQRSSNYGGNQRSGSFGGNQMSGNFGGSQMRPNNFGGSPARAGNFGKSQMGMNFGSRQFSRSINFPEPPMKLTDLPFVPVKMPRPLMETPSFLLGGRNKRFLDDDMPPYPAKRPRPAPTGPVLPPKVKNNFLVPVSEGTEKITMDIWNYFLSAKMEDADVKRKLRLRKCIMAIVKDAFPNCSLFIVGSSMTGFATKGSDVDMCLMISQEEIDQRRDASIILNSISKALRQCSCLDYRQVIKAKVPILKFFDKVSGVECDLNVNNLVGVRNTHLMRFYAYMDWRVRPLMLFIKKWARYHDINDASKQTISSYSLTLMLIHYLQVGVSPPIVPCLQETKPELFDVNLDVRQLSLNFEPHLDFVSENRATLGELFLGFLNYYANQFSFEDQIISVRLGRLLTFDEVAAGGNSMQWKYLNIEEPFERSNTARSVYEKFVFTRVLRVFQTSHQTLDKSRDLERILMRPF